MTDEYDSWRRYEDAKAFKNKLAEIEQLKEEIDMLKNRIEKLEAGETEFDRIIGGYASENVRFRDRIEKLEAALREIACNGSDWIKAYEIARKALEGKDE